MVALILQVVFPGSLYLLVSGLTGGNAVSTMLAVTSGATFSLFTIFASGLMGLFLQAAAGHILYLALHLESGSFPRPLPPDRERAAFADLQKGGAAAAQARDTLIRHNLRLVAHIVKKYYALPGDQEDLVSIGTIGLMKAVDTFDATRKARFSTYASRCIENAILSPAHFQMEKRIHSFCKAA